MYAKHGIRTNAVAPGGVATGIPVPGQAEFGAPVLRPHQVNILSLAMAEELDSDELRSDALNTRGIAKQKLDDQTAVDDLRRSVEFADSSKAVHQMATARNNLASVLGSFGRVRESVAVCREAVELGELRPAEQFLNQAGPPVRASIGQEAPGFLHARQHAQGIQVSPAQEDLIRTQLRGQQPQGTQLAEDMMVDGVGLGLLAPGVTGAGRHKGELHGRLPVEVADQDRAPGESVDHAEAGQREAAQ